MAYILKISLMVFLLSSNGFQVAQAQAHGSTLEEQAASAEAVKAELESKGSDMNAVNSSDTTVKTVTTEDSDGTQTKTIYTYKKKNWLDGVPMPQRVFNNIR